MQQQNFPQVILPSLSYSHHKVQAPSAQAWKDQRLPTHGGGVHLTLPEEGTDQTWRGKRNNKLIQEELKKIEQLRGLPMNVGTLE